MVVSKTPCLTSQRSVFTGGAAVCAPSRNAVIKMSTECSEGAENEVVASVVATARTAGASAEEATREPEFHSTIQVTNIW